MRTSSWRDSALCAQAADPELFFPDVGGDGDTVTRAARLVCAACPVRRECLEYAVATKQEHGIWGGKSREERRALRRAAALDAVA